MSDFGLIDRSLEGRRLDRVIVADKDTDFARQLFIFSALTLVVSIVTILVWLYITNEHINSDQINSESKEKISTSEGEKTEPPGLFFSKESTEKPSVNVDELLQDQENEVVVKSYNPAIQKIIAQRSEKIEPSVELPAPPKTAVPEIKKSPPLTNAVQNKETTPKPQSYEKKAIKKAALAEKKKSAIMPISLANQTHVVVEGSNLSQALKIASKLPQSSLAVTTKDLTPGFLKKLKTTKTPVVLTIDMEPLNQKIKLSPEALTQGMSSSKIETMLSPSFEKLPTLHAIKNRMGSAFLADKKSVEALFLVLKKYNLGFIDAATGRYKLREAAKKSNITYARYKKTITAASTKSELTSALKKLGPNDFILIQANKAISKILNV